MSDGPRHTSAILFSQLSRYFGTLFQLYNALLLLRPVLSVKRNPPRRWLYPAINKRKQQLCKNNEISRSPPRLYCFDFIPHVARLPTWTRVIYSHRSECSRWRPAGSWNFEIWYPIFLFIVTGFVPRFMSNDVMKIFAVDTQFKQLRKRSLKKIQASAGFEPVTSAIPVQCSTNWAMKP